ncbi:hypothetical protein [Nocardia thraciensis]
MSEPEPLAEKLFREALAHADREREPTAKASALLSAIHRFLDGADDFELGRNQGALQSGVVEAATIFPDAALTELMALAARRAVDEHTTREVLREWVRRPEEGSFPATWAAAAGLMEAGPNSLCVWLTQAVREGDTDVSPQFRRLARNHLTALVDSTFERYEFSGPKSPVWQMLYALGPGSRADWFCLLGDLAARRGDYPEASRRYELADRFGGSQAKQRLTRLRDMKAYDLLLRDELTAERLKGSGTPGPYRHLLTATAALVHGKSPVASLRQAAQGPADPSVEQAVAFLTAVEHLRAGDSRTARAKLRTVLDAPDGHTDLAANARLVLGALDGDDELVLAGVRILFERHGQRWFTRSMIDSTIGVTAAHGDLALLPQLIAARSTDEELVSGRELDAVCLAAARRILANAARAALSAQRDEARALVVRANQLLDRRTGAAAEQLRGKAARIDEIAARLDSTDAPGRPLDRLAFAALRSDGVRHPFTPRALRLWEQHDSDPDSDPRSLHHLAIAQHAHAYQLELDGDEAAFPQWARALGSWARLYGDSRFWDLMRTHMSTVMTDTSEVASAIDRVRADLPASLLELHVSRVLQLRTTRLPWATAHMRLIRTAPFPPAEISRARARLARDAGNHVRRLARGGHFDRALDEVAGWMQVDADNIPLAELALDVGIDAHSDARRREENWGVRSREVLERVATLVEPMRAALGITADQVARKRVRAADQPEGDPAAFASKLARHEFWLGVTLLEGAVDRASRYGNASSVPAAIGTQFRSAAYHLDQAVTLGLPAIAPYDQGREALLAARRWQRAVQGSTFGFF